ncbi:MAG: PA14 domain-containing protein [Vicinamibacterales bacterium]
MKSGPIRRWLWLVSSLLAVGLLIGRSRVPAGDGLEARYFPTEQADGVPSHVVINRLQSTDQIRADLGAASPTVFSVVWSGYLLVSSPGTFEFALSSDDGSQLFIDEQLVVDNGGRHSIVTLRGERRLAAGPHRVRLVFTNSGGDFSFSWSWARSGQPLTPVSAWLLSTRRARYPEALAARILDVAIPPAAALALAALLWALVGWLRTWKPRWAQSLAGACTHEPRFFVFHSCVRDGIDRRLAGIHLPGPPSFISPTLLSIVERIIVGAAFVLPIFFIGHALAFWGHGVIDEEATTFVINYLADRPFLQAIFDPVLNDWGSFQARELAYVFDRMDARVFARLLVDWKVFLFVPVSSLLALVAMSGIYLTGARRVLRLERTTALLLLSLFLSCIVTQASTPILYRSSKMLLCVALLAFLFRLASLLEPERPGVTVRNGFGLFGLGVAMAWCDRQGYALLLATATVMCGLWIRQRWLPQPTGRVARHYGAVAIGTTAATGWAILYNNVLAPHAILRLNGYWPDLSYESIPVERFNETVVRNTLLMFRDEVSYFFGNAPFIVVCALAVVVWTAVRLHCRVRPARLGAWGWITGTGVMLSTAIVGASVVLIAVMGMRHPPVFKIADHALWYYTLALQALMLFSVSLALSQLRSKDDGRRRRYVWVVLLLMIAGNVAHYPAQRRLLAASGDWFGKQLAFSQLYAQTFELDEAQAPDSARVLPSWMRVKPEAAEVHLPMVGYGLLDAVRAGYLTLNKRPPLVDAGGPYWRELREFLDGGGSPFLEPGGTVDGLTALQSVGIRRIVMHREQYQPPSRADGVVDAARAMGERVRQISEHDGLVVIELADIRPEPLLRGSWQPVPSSAFTLSASHSVEALGAVLDNQSETLWSGTTSQAGSEWIRVDFDTPRNLAALRLEMTDQALVRYPRHLRIESTGAGGVRTLFDGPALPVLARGILTEPVRAPIELAFSANNTRSLLIRQTGQSPSWNWAIGELRIFESSVP